MTVIKACAALALVDVERSDNGSLNRTTTEAAAIIDHVTNLWDHRAPADNDGCLIIHDRNQQ